jgi:predicted lipoprotein with Yx(FWY)xxD motif
MRRRIGWFFAISFVLAGGAYVGGAYAGGKSASNGPFLVPATPPGVTIGFFMPRELSPAGRAARRKAYGAGGALKNANGLGPLPSTKQVFATDRGVPLYTYNDDKNPLKSNCYADCAKAWLPYAVPPGFRPFGDWGLVKRTDGIQQLALRGKPLYSPADDTDPAGSAEPTAASPDDGDPWRAAEFKPTEGFKSPPQLSVKELFVVNGQVLVDAQQMTLYVSNDDKSPNEPKCYAKCTLTWMPAQVGYLGNAEGDFGIINRKDGLRQWTYKSKPLYRYSGDVLVGDVNGEGAAPGWHAAKIVDYFLPPDVRIRSDPSHGMILTTAGGRTLYARDQKKFSVGTHNARRGGELRGEPLSGWLVGTSGCDGECTQKWAPFVPAADAQPSGFWSIVRRADGTRQWAYLHYALYTYVEDKEPSDTRGHDMFDLTDGFNALYWRVALP